MHREKIYIIHRRRYNNILDNGRVNIYNNNIYFIERRYILCPVVKRGNAVKIGNILNSCPAPKCMCGIV